MAGHDDIHLGFFGDGEPVRVDVDLRDDISPELERIEKIPGALGEVAEAAGQVLVERAVAAFTRPGMRPQSWPARKDNKPHPLLQKSLALVQSLVSKAEANGAVIGSDRPYAAVHQFGSRLQNIPARPFFDIAGDGELGPVSQLLVERAVRIKVSQIVGREIEA